MTETKKQRRGAETRASIATVTQQLFIYKSDTFLPDRPQTYIKTYIRTGH